MSTTDKVRNFFSTNGPFETVLEARTAYEAIHGAVGYSQIRTVLLEIKEGRTKNTSSTECGAEDSDIIEKVSEKDIPYKAFKAPSTLLDILIHKGLRVDVADDSNGYYELFNVHHAGEPYWPKSGYTVRDQEGKKRCLEADCVRLSTNTKKK